MYSRNFASFENINTAKLNREQRIISGNQVMQTIPVKSYSDDSAFERFNNLGRSNKEDNSKKINDVEISEQSNVYEDIAASDSASEALSVDGEVIDISDKDITSKEKAKHFSLFDELLKGFSLVGEDWLLVILAVTIFIFGSNETNDKLTPIALLAIMFI